VLGYGVWIENWIYWSVITVSVLTSHCSVTVPNSGDSSALVLMSFLADDCLADNSWRQLTLNWTVVRVRVILRRVVYRQSVRLAPSHLRLTTSPFSFVFATEPLRSLSLCNILSDEKMGLTLMNMLVLSSSVRIAHTECYWKFFLLQDMQVHQSRLCKADHAYLTYLMLQRQLSHLNGRRLDHRQV
jgi:hypothetical protein